MAAQGIKQHEYWVDSDYGNRKSVSSSNTTLSLSVPTKDLSAGIHILNYRVQDTDDTWGVPNRMLFYVPENMSADATVNSCEYWIDDDYVNRKSGAGGASMIDDIDISELNPGLHLLNYQATNNFGEKGIISRQPFFVPANVNDDATIIRAVFWIDNDYDHCVEYQGINKIPLSNYDVSHLSPGIHILNCLAVSFYRGFGDDISHDGVSRMLFYVPEHISKNVAIEEYEYWIDDNIAEKKTGTDAQKVYSLTMDVSKLSEGDHAFYLRAKNTDGVWGTVFTEKFSIGEEVDDNIISFACPVAGSICVENWDTDGDGKLSKTEAAAVESLGEVFKESEITSFDELQYFTGLTKIDDEAFDNCTKLASVKLPAAVTEIGRRAFSHCIFSEIEFPSGLTYIDTEAFYHCESLKSIRIPSSVENMSVVAFVSCTAVESIVVEEGNEAFDSREGCNAIIRKSDKALIRGCKNTIIPAGVERINFAAFQWTPLEGAFVIPEGVTYIGRSAFVSTTMSSISLPSTLTDIDGLSFQDCNNIESVDIPDGVTSIGDYAFSFCDNLKSVSIPKSVTEIGEKAFIGDTKLESVVSQIPQPFAISKNVFISEDMDDGVEELIDATLYVPYGTKTIYETTDGWKEFKNIVEKDETAPITIGKSGKASYCGDKSLDFSYSDKIKAYIATGFDKDEGIIWLTRVKDVPAGVPVLIKGDANKTYDVPVTDSENSYYKNMFVGNTTGEKIQIQETSDDGSKVNYYLSGDGTFKSVNKSANIGNNKCYLQLPGTFNAAVEGSSQAVTVGASGKASFAAPVDLDFTNVDGLKAFTATGYDKSTKTIWLTRVMKVQKGEGVLLKGDPNSYEIPSATVQSSYMNMFVGNIGEKIQVPETSEDGSQTNFYLNSNGAFVSVNGYANIGNNKCYLELPTSMVAVAASTRGAEANYLLDEPEMIKLPILFRSIGNDGEGTTGIKVQSSMQPDNAYYTLQGQRVQNPGKGLYIKNGKKIVIK